MSNKIFRLRFGLCSLLVATLFAAVGFAWLGAELRYAKRQHIAVNTLLELGGKIYWDYEFVDGRLTWGAYEGKAKAPGPSWLKSLAGDNGLAEVAYFQAGFDEPELTDDDMVHVGQLRGLQTVFFHQTKLTDSGIFHLRGLPQLRCFLFRGEGITNKSVQYLNSMPQLSEVGLTNTRIDDDGLEELSSNDKLWRLEIDGTKITDKGLVITNKQGERQTIEADTIVCTADYKPNTELSQALAGISPELHLVGDCVEPLGIAEAIRDGSQIGRII